MNNGEIRMGEALKNPIQIKGIREGLLISLGEGTFKELQKQLLGHIDHQLVFFNGARLALDTGGLTIKASELGALRDQLSERGVSLWAVISSAEVTETTARMLGLSTRLTNAQPEKSSSDSNRPVEAGDRAVLVRKTIRSGVYLEYDGHITVVGDVNPGAEISATGNVVVWGRLLGSAHAGSRGDQNAFICALEMSPTYIHIAGLIMQLSTRKGKIQPEIARIANEKIIIEAWKPKP
jgi:septum site-determining protein MinC